MDTSSIPWILSTLVVQKAFEDGKFPIWVDSAKIQAELTQKLQIKFFNAIQKTIDECKNECEVVKEHLNSVITVEGEPGS
jgi:hypothetical protein